MATANPAAQRQSNTAVPGFGVSELLLEINRQSIQFTNLTDQPVTLQHFAPGTVQWGDNLIDLNSLRSHTTMPLPAFTSRQHRITVRQSNTLVSDGLWADEAVVTKGNGESAVLLGAYVHDYRIHLYPIPSVRGYAIS